MKKLFFALSALAALSLLAPSAGFAAMGTSANQIGIYSDPTGDTGATNVQATIGVPFTAYLVLTNPVNHSFDGGTNTNVPVTAIEAFECRVVAPAGLGATWFQMSEILPPQSIDVGTKPDYVVGIAAPVPVTDAAVILVTWQFMVLSGDPLNWYLDVTTEASIAGTMAYQDSNDLTVLPPANIPLESAFPASGDFASPVFSVNGSAVAIENESWGNVKALFR